MSSRQHTTAHHNGPEGHCEIALADESGLVPAPAAATSVRRRWTGGSRLRLAVRTGLLALVAAVAICPVANAATPTPPPVHPVPVRPVPVRPILPIRPLPPVHLSGWAICTRPGDHTTAVYIWQWQPIRALQPAHVGRFPRYDIDLPAVPAPPAAAQVIAHVTCDGHNGPYSLERRFPVTHPRWGTTVIRDLIG